MSFVRSAGLPLTLAIAFAAVGCAQFPVGAPTAGAPEPTASASPFSQADLRGRVLVPVVSAGGNNVIAASGGNVIAASGGNVVSPGGGNVVSPGGGNVISPGGGNVISAGGLNYRIAQAMERELPVVGAVVVLRDPVTRQRLPWVAPVFTDEKGEFSFPGVPAGMNYLVDVTFVTPDSKAFRLMTVVRPEQPAEVDWCSTVVASALAASAGTGMYNMDAQGLAVAVADIERLAAAMPPDEANQRMTQAVASTFVAPTGQEAAIADPVALAAMRDRLGQLGRTGATVTLVVPDVLGAVDLGAAAIGQALAEKDAALAGHLGALKQAASSSSSVSVNPMVTLKPTSASQPSSSTSGTSGSSGNGATSGSAPTSSSGGTAGATDAAGATGGLTQTVTETVTGATQTVGSTVGGATGAVGSAVSNTTNAAGSAVSDTTSAVGGAASNVVGSTSNTVGSALSGLTGGSSSSSTNTGGTGSTSTTGSTSGATTSTSTTSSSSSSSSSPTSTSTTGSTSSSGSTSSGSTSSSSGSTTSSGGVSVSVGNGGVSVGVGGSKVKIGL